MIKSMTGYGKGEAENEGLKYVVELRSVNHRYCDISIRIPRRYAALEGEIKKVVAGAASRGKIDVTLTVEGCDGVGSRLEINTHLADSYYSLMCTLKDRFGLSGEITLRDISSIPDIITMKEDALDIKRDWVFIEAAAKSGLDALDGMKKTEGEALTADIFGRLGKIGMVIDDVEKYAPEVIESYNERLAERIRGMGYEPDQGRLVQEIACFADRCDISEEIVRLKSHLVQFKAIAFSPEPSGRKLDFLIQEINREINTIGSKGNDAVISQNVVEVKAELERVREQVQNIE